MNTKEFDKILEGAVAANEAQVFSNFNEKVANLQKIVIDLVEKKEEELSDEKIAHLKRIKIGQEIKIRREVAVAKTNFYKKFYSKIKAMKVAYDKLQK